MIRLVGVKRNGAPMSKKMLDSRRRRLLPNLKVDPEEKNIKNDFAPNMRNEYFSVNNIISCLQHGFMRMNKLPPEIADMVQEELNHNVVEKLPNNQIGQDNVDKIVNYYSLKRKEDAQVQQQDD